MKNQNPKNVVIQRSNYSSRNQPILPTGTFRNSFVKSLSRTGRRGENYNFTFEIVEEYQDKRFDNGKSVYGYGYTINVIDAPDMYECQNEDDFHFYHNSICWDSLITSFQDANAIMYQWHINYCKLLDKRNKRSSYYY